MSGHAKVGGPYLTTYVNRTLALEFDGANNPIYIGAAAPGSLTSSPVWLIRKLTFDGSNNLTAIQYAGGTSDYTAIWDNRAALSYS